MLRYYGGCAMKYNRHLILNFATHQAGLMYKYLILTYRFLLTIKSMIYICILMLRDGGRAFYPQAEVPGPVM